MLLHAYRKLCNSISYNLCDTVSSGINFTRMMFYQATIYSVLCSLEAFDDSCSFGSSSIFYGSENQVTVEFISGYQMTVRRNEYNESVLFSTHIIVISLAIIHSVT